MRINRHGRHGLFTLLLLLLLLSACSHVPSVDPALPEREDAWRIRVIGPDGSEAWSFVEAELAQTAEPFTQLYSAINNWPTPRFYAAEGYRITGILQAAGLDEIMQTVTFRAEDGYEISLTREQLLSAQYYYPQVGENESGAEQVSPIIAYRWREGTGDLSTLGDNKPSLIFGQRNPFEHTNPAFVVGVAEIIVSDTPCEKWPLATTFPLPGPIASGETVKLQHPDIGLVKLHYTLDGSEPTLLSPMYNPSTYQLELNAPIPIIEPTVIKVLASGYGKADSEIAVFEFTPLE